MHGNCQNTHMHEVNTHKSKDNISIMHMRLSEAPSTHMPKKRVYSIHVEFYHLVLYVAYVTGHGCTATGHGDLLGF